MTFFSSLHADCLPPSVFACSRVTAAADCLLIDLHRLPLLLLLLLYIMFIYVLICCRCYYDLFSSFIVVIDKTDLMLVTSKRTKHLHSLPTSITLGNAQIPLKKSVKNLGFTLDCHLTMNAHVSNIARTCYFELRRLASIRRFLTSTATATLVSAFVLSRIDYCSSLLFGSTHDVTSHLQRIQNYAARVILRLPKSSSITIHLKSLHWLPVKVRSTYKIACLCYHCHSSTAPSYVTGMLHTKPLHTRNTRSSSYTMPLLNRPAHSKATLGDRSFSFASSSVWNSIPNDVRCAHHCHNLSLV